MSVTHPRCYKEGSNNDGQILYFLCRAEHRQGCALCCSRNSCYIITGNNVSAKFFTSFIFQFAQNETSYCSGVVFQKVLKEDSFAAG